MVRLCLLSFIFPLTNNRGSNVLSRNQQNERQALSRFILSTVLSLSLFRTGIFENRKLISKMLRFLQYLHHLSLHSHHHIQIIKIGTVVPYNRCKVSNRIRKYFTTNKLLKPTWSILNGLPFIYAVSLTSLTSHHTPGDSSPP